MAICEGLIIGHYRAKGLRLRGVRLEGVAVCGKGLGFGVSRVAGGEMNTLNDGNYGMLLIVGIPDDPKP